jgi:2-dehydropantoate 2-reductase
VADNLLHISRLSDGQLISTLQDIQQHRLTEIDTLNFEIARIGAAAGLSGSTPLTSLLGELTAIKSSLSL